MQQVTGVRGMSSTDYRHEYSPGQVWGIIDVMQGEGKQMETCDSALMVTWNIPYCFISSTFHKYEEFHLKTG